MLRGLVGGQTYIQKVLTFSPTAYWPMNEAVGGDAFDQSGNSYDGAYTGVTLNQTVTDAAGVSFVCPLFDGANDFVDVHSAELEAAYDGSEGSAVIWLRVFDADVWEDDADRYTANYDDNVDSRVRPFRRNGVDNQLVSEYRAAGTQESQTSTLGPTINWVHVGITWSKSTGASGEVKYYAGGSQEGDTDTTLGVWGGAPVRMFLGSRNSDPASPWYGWLAHAAIWAGTVLTAAQMVDLATV